MKLSTLFVLLIIGCCFTAAELMAQDSSRPLNQAIDLNQASAELDVGAKGLLPNHRGVFAGVNLETYGIVINGQEYPGAVHEIPVFYGQQIKPIYELQPNTQIRFHVDGDGAVRAIWVEGELQE